MWRLWHKLFGWHYVAVVYAGQDHIRRIFRVPSGEHLIRLYGDFYRPIGDFEKVESINTGRVHRCTPLTWRQAPARAA